MTPVADLSDPEAGCALVEALSWIERIMLGPVAATLAVVGVALVGLFLLQGRLAWRRGLAVCLGCFVVFWGKTLALDLMETFTVELVEIQTDLTSPSALASSKPQPLVYDPYAGASLAQ